MTAVNSIEWTYSELRVVANVKVLHASSPSLVHRFNCTHSRQLIIADRVIVTSIGLRHLKEKRRDGRLRTSIRVATIDTKAKRIAKRR